MRDGERLGGLLGVDVVGERDGASDGATLGFDDPGDLDGDRLGVLLGLDVVGERDGALLGVRDGDPVAAGTHTPRNTLRVLHVDAGPESSHSPEVVASPFPISPETPGELVAHPEHALGDGAPVVVIPVYTETPGLPVTDDSAFVSPPPPPVSVFQFAATVTPARLPALTRAVAENGAPVPGTCGAVSVSPGNATNANAEEHARESADA